MLRTLCWLPLVAVLLCGCERGENADGGQTAGGTKMELQVTSPAFGNGAAIPIKHTCDGENSSPPLEWSSVPEGAKTIALIADDPDAPRGTWVHWVLYNLPANVRDLHEDVPGEFTLPNGALQGKNSSEKIGYQGPCPPNGTHRYFFKLYALDTELDLEPGATKAELTEAMQGHIIAEGQLMGTYTRAR